MNLKPAFYYEIVFPDFEPSDAVKADVERYLVKLEHIFDRIISCHVAIRSPHRHHKKHIYHVNIQLKIPGQSLVVDHEPEKDMSHSDVHIAIRDAFKAMDRQLQKKVASMKDHSGGPERYESATEFDLETEEGHTA